MAIFTQANSIFAEVAEVSVSRRGKLTVERIVAAIDCRYAANALGVESQVEAGVNHALSAVIYGEIGIRAGRVIQQNYDDYRLLMMSEAPDVETHLVLSGGKEWGGVGELPHSATAPAIYNAVFDATGKRLRALPIMKHDLSWS